VSESNAYTFDYKRDFWRPQNPVIEAMSDTEIAESPEAFKSLVIITIRSVFPLLSLFFIVLGFNFILAALYTNFGFAVFAAESGLNQWAIDASNRILAAICDEQTGFHLVQTSQHDLYTGFLILNLFAWGINLASLLVLGSWYFASFKAGVRLPSVTQIGLERSDITLTKVPLPSFFWSPMNKNIGCDHGTNTMMAWFGTGISLLATLSLIYDSCELFMFGAPRGPSKISESFLLIQNLEVFYSYVVLSGIVPFAVLGLALTFGYLRLNLRRRDDASPS